MPRVRPDDFRQLDSPHANEHPWARWWRHRDGTVSHVHYGGDGHVIALVRHDDVRNTPFVSDRPA